MKNFLAVVIMVFAFISSMAKAQSITEIPAGTEFYITEGREITIPAHYSSMQLGANGWDLLNNQINASYNNMSGRSIYVTDNNIWGHNEDFYINYLGTNLSQSFEHYYNQCLQRNTDFKTIDPYVNGSNSSTTIIRGNGNTIINNQINNGYNRPYSTSSTNYGACKEPKFTISVLNFVEANEQRVLDRYRRDGVTVRPLIVEDVDYDNISSPFSREQFYKIRISFTHKVIESLTIYTNHHPQSIQTWMLHKQKEESGFWGGLKSGFASLGNITNNLFEIEFPEVDGRSNRID